MEYKNRAKASALNGRRGGRPPELKVVTDPDLPTVGRVGKGQWYQIEIARAGGFVHATADGMVFAGPDTGGPVYQLREVRGARAAQLAGAGRPLPAMDHRGVPRGWTLPPDPSGVRPVGPWGIGCPYRDRPDEIIALLMAQGRAQEARDWYSGVEFPPR